MEEEQTHIMKDSDDMESQEEEEEEREEALSLCDLPLNRNSRTPSLDDMSFKKILRPSSLPDHAGEIFNGFSSSSSSDMCPADDIIFCGKLVPFKAEQPLKNLIAAEEEKSPARRRRSESVVPPEAAVKKATKPRWYSLMFGTMKIPPEMELSDMKNRQVRRNPSSTMFLTADSGGKMAVNRSHGKVSWRILKALSCKDHSSVAVTTSFPLPQAS
eukprot:XP_025983068.1 uncharacterized protein LOC100777782 isoform X2 [Glycine max]